MPIPSLRLSGKSGCIDIQAASMSRPLSLISHSGIPMLLQDALRGGLDLPPHVRPTDSRPPVPCCAQDALAAAFVEGWIFFLISVSGARGLIMELIPHRCEHPTQM